MKITANENGKHQAQIERNDETNNNNNNNKSYVIVIRLYAFMSLVPFGDKTLHIYEYNLTHIRIVSLNYNFAVWCFSSSFIPNFCACSFSFRLSLFIRRSANKTSGEKTKKTANEENVCERGLASVFFFSKSYYSYSHYCFKNSIRRRKKSS